jgi:hypothetical protein
MSSHDSSRKERSMSGYHGSGPGALPRTDKKPQNARDVLGVLSIAIKDYDLDDIKIKILDYLSNTSDVWNTEHDRTLNGDEMVSIAIQEFEER